MLISLKNNIAILAMTKTGSTSAEAELAQLCDIVFTHDPRVKHMQVRKFDRFLRPYLESMGCQHIETTCLFREPVDWLGSWYRYRQRDKLRGKPNSTAGITFEAFVINYLSDTPAPFAKVGRQSKFVINKNGAVGIDHLFRYERFERFEAFLSDRFGQPFSFEKLNTSKPQTLELTKQTRAKLETELAFDYEIYEGLAG